MRIGAVLCAITAAVTLAGAAVVPAQAMSHEGTGQAAQGPIWSTVGTHTTNCPSTVHVLTPNKSADYFAQNPDDLLVAGGFQAGGAATTRLLHDAAARHMHWLPAMTCKPGQPGKPAPRRTSVTYNGSPNWSGYVTSQSYGYIGATMEWYVNGVSANADSDAHVSTWPGVGTGDSTADTLVQAGTDQEADCYQPCSSSAVTPWFELYPQESEQDITNLAVAAGDLVGVIVEYDPASQSAYFEEDDLTTSYGVYFYQDLTGDVVGSGSQAEWIVERPTECLLGCEYSQLANFSTEYIFYAQAASGDWSDPYYSQMGDDDSSEVDMTSCDGGTVLASPTLEDSQDFTVTWQNQGVIEHC